MFVGVNSHPIWHLADMLGITRHIRGHRGILGHQGGFWGLFRDHIWGDSVVFYMAQTAILGVSLSLYGINVR